MTVAAVAMGGAGVLLQFAPVETVAWLGARADALTPLLGQVIGAALLGFSMLNWMSRRARMGGIYARPLVMGNLLHFVTGGLALLKGASASTSLGLWAVAAVYAAFAVAFTLVLITHPVDRPSTIDRPST
jgi:hypothetical protein